MEAVASAGAVCALATAAVMAVDDDIVGQVLRRRETAAAGGDVLNALAARSWIAMPVLFLQRSIMVCACLCVCALFLFVFRFCFVPLAP